MLKKTLLSLALFSTSSFAYETLNVVPELSSISFATIKKQYVVEPAIVEDVQGQYSNNTFNISINFNSVDTGVSIRNNRINELFLKTNLYPLVKIKGNVELESMKEPVTKTKIKADVDFYGRIKTYEIPVIIHKTKELTTVNSYKPIIVKASDFGIPKENLIKLAATVGGFTISDTIPLNINLAFKAVTK